LSILCVEAQFNVNPGLLAASLIIRNNFRDRPSRCYRDSFGIRRCPNRHDLDLLPLMAFSPMTPAVGVGCFPDAATFQRQTRSGSFDRVRPKELHLGDKVKCLRAPLGPATDKPEVGVCKFVSKGHTTGDIVPYHEIAYTAENGEEKLVAMTSHHMMWATKDRIPLGPVNPKNIEVANDMLVSIENVGVGDVIIVENNNVLEYHRVTAHYEKNMTGINNPVFLDGGLPFVNGVLATSTARPNWGGHWGSYYKSYWLHDDKFTDPDAARLTFKKGPLYAGELAGNITVDNTCFLKKIVADLKDGIDISNYKSYDGGFAEVYVTPCVRAKA